MNSSMLSMVESDRLKINILCIAFTGERGDIVMKVCSLGHSLLMCKCQDDKDMMFCLLLYFQDPKQGLGGVDNQ
jgi:hypothetical protein